MILHVDMDAFFASIEQAINPRLKDKPLIVGSRGKRMHNVVCAASYPAKRMGIHSGMPTPEAFKICPDLEFVAADQSKYIWTSEQILQMLKGYNLPLNYASIDEFQLEVSGCPDPVELAKKIKAQIYANFNITASVGIARNWILAKLASKLNKPDGLTLINESNFEQILKETPLDKLCGMGGKIGADYIASGLKTCWDLYLNLPGFFEVNGASDKNFRVPLDAAQSYDNSLNGDENPGKSDEHPKSVGHSYTLPRNEINPQVIRAWTRLLSEMVATRLRGQNLVSKTVHLWLSGPEIGNFGAQKTYQWATNDGNEICQRALKIMEKMPQKNPKIRAIGVTCSGLLEDSYNPLLSEDIRREGLIKALDRINNRFGEEAIHPAITILTRQKTR